ncbi:MAG: hypothetical protein H6709_14030 [Kofleriaceae bacterium]|nr:hypothetical protein [Myxococcales bacterium]MCB9565461.1 hypothetical protein [Kofleriaceae bacterium]MCB9573199.1 hypothetical protein [Kofleriaceae bacterium]
MIPATSPRLELAIGMLGLVAALAVLPLPTVAGTPEAASVLAVGAIALLAGHRWGLALVVLADVVLVGALWPRAFLHDPPSTSAQLGVALGLAGALPGVVALRRTTPAVVELLLGERGGRHRAVSRILLPVLAALWIASPLM